MFMELYRYVNGEILKREKEFKRIIYFVATADTLEIVKRSEATETFINYKRTCVSLVMCSWE